MKKLHKPSILEKLNSSFFFFLCAIGNVLLPPMGFCEIHESSKDSRQKFTNTNKFVCEISPNILYQYVLIILWFLIVFSIIISICGLIINLVGHLVTVTCFLRHDSPSKAIYKRLTFREVEYLEMIRRRNIPAFGEIIRRLQQQRIDCRTEQSFDANDVPMLTKDVINTELSTIMNNHNNHHLNKTSLERSPEVAFD